MKKFVSSYKKLFLSALFLIGLTGLLFGYQNGDYRTVQDGSWFSNIWEVYNNGQWEPAGPPSSNEPGTIYIQNKVGLDHSVIIYKDLEIRNNGYLFPSPYSSVNMIIKFYGGSISVNGYQSKLGGNYGNHLILEMRNDFNNIQVITGSGYIKLRELNIYSKVHFTARTTVNLLRVFENATVESRDHLKEIRDLQICYKNAEFKIYSRVNIGYRVMVGAGNNFNEAAELFIGSGGTLYLPSDDDDGYPSLRLGCHDQYAKLTLLGARIKATITSEDNEHWSIFYPSTYSDGHKIQIRAENAVFENMDNIGLEIRSGVHIVNDRFVNCTFRNRHPEENTPSTLLYIDSPRLLSIINSKFDGILDRFSYNIAYLEPRGLIRVINATGNLAGEQYDFDRYNRVIWYNYRKDNSTDKSNMTTNAIKTDNYPNPFNPTTTISYQLPAKSKVNLAIYNIKGEKVKTLVNETQELGEHTIVWNGLNDKNEKVPSGIYFYKLKTGNSVITRKITLLK